MALREGVLLPGFPQKAFPWRGPGSRLGMRRGPQEATGPSTQTCPAHQPHGPRGTGQNSRGKGLPNHQIALPAALWAKRQRESRPM